MDVIHGLSGVYLVLYAIRPVLRDIYLYHYQQTNYIPRIFHSSRDVMKRLAMVRLFYVQRSRSIILDTLIIRKFTEYN